MNLSESHQAAVRATARAQELLLDDPAPRKLPGMTQDQLGHAEGQAKARAWQLVDVLTCALCAARRIEHLVCKRPEP